MRPYTVVLGANETRTVQAGGDYIKVLAPVGAYSFEIATGTGESIECQAGQGKRTARKFMDFRITNLQAVAVTAEVLVGSGELFIDDTVAGNVGVAANVGIVGLSPVTIDGTLQTIAGNAARKRLLLRARDTNAGYIFVGGVPPNGYPMWAMDALEIDVSGDVDVQGNNLGDMLLVSEVI